ncbi:hypothetical protein RND81_02G242100 [Saponaria officinalis]|uniref:Uncharacterized protein n=1 Tax=Saponaria officinalis TaxID=3572 RepID=A0AAW1MZX2_SAPOF
MIANLCAARPASDSLVTYSTDYAAFRRLRLAPPVLRCEVRTRVTLPSARVKVVGPNGEETYVDIPEASDPIEGLPFPPDFKGFDRTDSEKLWRLLRSSLKRVAELITFVNLWSSVPKVSFVGPNPLLATGSAAGSVDIPSRLSELERMLSLSSDARLNVHDVRGASHEGPRSRGVLRNRRAIIESDSDGGD